MEDLLLKDLGQYFESKDKFIGSLKIYVGGHVWKVQLEIGVQAWDFSSSKYVKSAMKNVKSYLKNLNKWKIPGKAQTPMQMSYTTELFVTPVMGPTESAYYQ